MKILAVVPARAGSTRLKGKNLYPLLGKPLIRWVTEAVVNSGCFNNIIISTDSDQIFDAVSDLPVIRHNRILQLATAQATVLDAIIHLMQGIQEEYDAIAYFLPTCPFINASDIQLGVARLEDSDTVVSMTPIQETIQLACLIHNNHVMPIFDNIECGLTNSRYLKKYYKPSGAFYMGRWQHILANKNFFKGNVKCVMVPAEQSVDINCLSDIHYAETIYNNMRIETD